MISLSGFGPRADVDRIQRRDGREGERLIHDGQVAANSDDALRQGQTAKDKPSNPGAGRHRRYIFLTHFVAFLMASSGAFLPRNEMLLPGTDGEFARATATQLFRLANPLLGLSMAP